MSDIYSSGKIYEGYLKIVKLYVVIDMNISDSLLNWIELRIKFLNIVFVYGKLLWGIFRN